LQDFLPKKGCRCKCRRGNYCKMQQQQSVRLIDAMRCDAAVVRLLDPSERERRFQFCWSLLLLLLLLLHLLCLSVCFGKSIIDGTYGVRSTADKVRFTHLSVVARFPIHRSIDRVLIRNGRETPYEVPTYLVLYCRRVGN
jgi:hypothetical protein